MLWFYLSLVETDHDKQKIQRVYEKYYGLMMYIASRYCPRQSDAEDVVHDAIIKIIKHLDCVDTSDEVRTKSFCTTVVKHTALDRLKAKESHVISMEDMQEQSVHVNDFAISNDAYADLVREIRALDDPCRIVLTLRYVNDLPIKQIAVLLEVSESAVSMRLTRAKRKLRKALEEANHDA